MTPKRIIYNAMHEAGFRTYHRLMRDKQRGKVAAQVIATWLPSVQHEAVDETDYHVDQLLLDVVEAMGHHGEPGFDAKCAAIGQKIVTAAMDYVLSAHESEGEDAEAELAADERENHEIERSTWNRDLYGS